MVVRVRIDPIAKDVSLIVSELLSPKAQSKAVADFARQGIAEGDATNKLVLGRVPPRETTVDGTKGAALENVRPNGGTIITEWEIVGDLMIWIGNTLRDRSPVISGDYRKAHTLFADDREVLKGEQIPVASEYVFLNPLPYARKIEIGKTKSGRDFLVQVPNRIYERTAKDAQARFGNIAKVKFTYRAAAGGSIIPYVPIRRTTTRGKNGRFQSGVSAENQAAADRERALRVPAILVLVKDR